MSRSKDVFLDALELDVDERAAFVRNACGDDAELFAEVQRLLVAHAQSNRIFGDPDATPQGVQPGTRVGAFVLMDQIGEGGFATVWRARQTEPVQRVVALKVLKAGMDTEQVVARFAAEQQALAMMDHPGIAMVFDGGVTESLRPWFAMEFVDGVPLTQYCDQRELDKRERLELFLQVCRAVQHAHMKGVIHRDLKPSNILVGEVDGRAVMKVIDFGIAKAIEQRLTDSSIVTMEGQVVGTPAYMSPEQLDESAGVDTRCDVYALGVLLYELLAGARPFDDDTLRDVGLAEVLRIIRDVEPPRPSARTTTQLRARELRGDLDWIVMRCLEKDRERRYDSADVLANEIERHLAGEPVLAGPPDLGYRTRKFVGRHQVALSVAGIIMVVLVVGIVVSTYHMLRAQDAEARSKVERSRFEDISLFYESILTGVDPAVARTADTTLLRKLLGRATNWVERDFVDKPEVEADIRRAIGMAYLSLWQDELAEPQLQRALQLRRDVIERDDEELARAMEELAIVHARAERLDRAEPLQLQAVDLFERSIGRDAQQTLRAAGDLAVTWRKQKRYDEAEKLLRDLIERSSMTIGEASRTTMTLRNNLAAVLENLDRREEAVKLYVQVFEQQREMHGALHPQTVITLNNVAKVMGEQGQLRESLSYLEFALAAKRDMFDDGHPSLLIALNNLGETHRELGEFDRSLAYCDEAWAMVERTGAKETPIGIKLRFNNARTRGEMGDAEAAAAIYRECWQRAEKLMGPNAQLTAGCKGAEGWQLVKLGKAKEAEPLLEACLAWCLQNGGEGTAATATNQIRMGVCQRDLGRPERARGLLEKGLPVVQKQGSKIWIDIGEQALRSLGK